VLSWGLAEPTVRQIPIGSNIPTTTVLPEAVAVVRRRLGLRPADALLGYFGFLNESKGADLLVQALAQLPPHVHLVFIGGRTGDSDQANNQAFLEQLDGLIERLGLGERVHWSGFLDDSAVSEHLQASDLMVLPYRDGVSLRRGTLMAALAHGRPVVSTTPNGPVPELAHGENIWLVPPGDVGGAGRRPHRLLDDHPLRDRLGAGALATAPSSPGSALPQTPLRSTPTCAIANGARPSWPH
jgi:polysaccharide biosynthesis protein PslF